MNKLYKFVLKYIAKKIIVQGPWHQHNLIEYYEIMAEAAKEEFDQDLPNQLDAFLRNNNNIAIYNMRKPVTVKEIKKHYWECK